MGFTEIVREIKEIKIQGAVNVAKASVKAIEAVLKEYKFRDKDILFKSLNKAKIFTSIRYDYGIRGLPKLLRIPMNKLPAKSLYKKKFKIKHVMKKLIALIISLIIPMVLLVTLRILLLAKNAKS